MNNRWIRPVLVVSLAVNLVLVGLIGGFVLRVGGPPHPATPHLSDFARELSPEQKTTLRHHLRSSRTEGRQLRRAVMLAQRQLTQELKAEEWNEEKITAARQALHTASETLQEHLQTQMMAMLAEMPVEERRRVLNNMAKRHWDRKGNRGRWRPNAQPE